MAGGATTVDLALATTRAGALSFLAAGYKKPEAMAAEITAFRAASSEAFGVNLFVPDPAVAEVDIAAYAKLIQSEADRLGVAVGRPGRTDDYFGEKLDLLITDPVPAVSFTFGLPDTGTIQTLRALGTVVLATVTNPSEALTATDAGVDLIVIQAESAGGHRATFGNYSGSRLPLLELVKAVRDCAGVGLIAAGGVGTSDDLKGVLQAGVLGAQIGTAFLAAEESGVAPGYKAALTAEGASTAVTRAFTGRPARGIVNRFMTAYESQAPKAYPQVQALTAPIRQAGMRAGDTSVMSLWAGAGHRRAQAKPAEQIVEDLFRGL
jgi:NAD(P)H-dependent flavin oxidoreductase YrpB (nitropropane dioxygenase family)